MTIDDPIGQAFRDEALALARADLASSHPEHAAAPVYVVWSCKALANRKYVLGAPSAGLIYEATYDGAARTWYLDRYRKEANTVHASDARPAQFAQPPQTQTQSQQPQAGPQAGGAEA